MDIRPIDHTPAPGAGLSGLKSGVPAAGATRGAEPATQAEPVAASAAPAPEELKQALSSINEVLKDRAPGLEFSFDKDDARLVVKVIDKDTNEVIRQMPSREALEIAKALDKLQSLLSKQSA